MKSSFFSTKSIAAAVLLALLGTQAALANTVVVTRNTALYSGANGGGEFTATGLGLTNSDYAPIVNITPTGLQVFCLETQELFTPGATYYYTLSTGAISGDTAGNFDPLSVGTAWLFSQFAQGTLPLYDYTPGAGRTASATLLQNAIWWLENEPADGSYTGLYDGSNPYEALVVSHFGSAAAAQADATLAQLGHVRVMNLTTDADGRHWAQSQLIYVPDNAETLALLGLGLIAMAVIRRRKLV
jgi:hypothetical protein